MKAIRVHENGNSNVLKIDKINVPICNSNEVKIKIEACAINHLDIWVRMGIPGLPINLPIILGSDGSGRIIETGKNVSDYKVGDDVVIQPGTFDENCFKVIEGKENYSKSYGILGEHCNGIQAEYVCLKPINIYKKPKHLSYEESSSMQLVFMTSYQMIVERANLLKNESVLIYGATSGVGSAAIQISKDIGANVIATVGNNQKKDYAYKMGADYVFLHDDKLIENVKSITKSNGVDVVVEHVGKKTWNQSMRLLSKGGRLVTCGATTGAIVEIDLRYLFSKQQTILGSTMSNLKSFNAIMDKINRKIYKPFIDEVFYFKDIKDAHLRMENRNNYGKIILIP